MNTKATYKSEAKNCTIGFARFEDGSTYYIVYDHVLNLADRILFDSISDAEDYLKSDGRTTDLHESSGTSASHLSAYQELVVICMDIKQKDNADYQFPSVASKSSKLITGNISDDGLGQAYAVRDDTIIH